jgi:hypothetical protein
MIADNKEKKSVREVLFSAREINCSSSLFTRPYAMRLFPFPRIKGQMKGKCFDYVSKVKKKTLKS